MVSESKVREILFRGKRTKNGEWATGLLYHHCEKASAIYSDDLDKVVWVRPETVGQYTGFTDKNGKRIFEGDVLFEDYIGEDFATGEENVHQRDLRSSTGSSSGARRVGGVIGEID